MATKWASPAGGGTGNSSVSPFQISDFLAIAAPGDTLNLLGTDPTTDGHYTGANSMIQPGVGVAGNAGNPITIQAVNDGGCEIDGQSVRMPIKLRAGNNYFVIQGMNCHSSGAGVGAVITINGSHNSIKRVVAWDSAIDYNYHIFSIAGSTAGDTTNGYANLIEDCGSFGIGRKNYESFQSGGNTFRRIWGRWESSINTGPKRGLQPNYYSYNTIVDNAIFRETINFVAPQSPTYIVQNNGVDFLTTTPWPGTYLVPRTSTDSKTVVGSGGSITFNLIGGTGAVFTIGHTIMAYRHVAPTSVVSTYMLGTVTGNAGSTVTFDVVSSSTAGAGPFTDWDITNQYQVTVPKQEGSQGCIGESEYDSSIDTQANGNDLLSGILFLHDSADLVAYQGSASSLYAPLTLLRFGNQLVQDCFVYAPGVTEVNAGSNLRGYYLFVSASALAHGALPCTVNGLTSVITGTSFHDANWTVNNEVTNTTLAGALGTGSLYTGSSGANLGARLKYRYQNGVLTSNLLWPWPMSARIKAATTQASTDGHSHPIEDVDALVQGIFGTFPVVPPSPNGVWFTP